MQHDTVSDVAGETENSVTTTPLRFLCSRRSRIQESLPGLCVCREFGVGQRLDVFDAASLYVPRPHFGCIADDG
jgi:hypothetical protein